MRAIDSPLIISIDLILLFISLESTALFEILLLLLLLFRLFFFILVLSILLFIFLLHSIPIPMLPPQSLFKYILNYIFIYKSICI
ncbi:hypothetical protein FE548_05690 [Clostridioides difficile]|nr:hypothetical protein [Clostridioides difficile]MBH9819341.1 hypothetical protein [Clostridioides difficile]MBH9827219.1 hypothetical protein [Clostridioides difficile]MBH9839624.1 hypothetical protein [Clostridioides difficile]MBH9846096.1 hypothetical protein [Clostridioides difficile]